MKMIIIGGGFNGQLLHTLFPYARVFDWRPARPSVPPRQLGAQYLWEPIPGLRCDQFNVVTHIDGQRATDTLIRRYKEKVGKVQDGGDWCAQFRENMPGYSVHLPEDHVEYGQRIVNIDTVHRVLHMAGGRLEKYDILVSTIPLDTLMQLCGIRRIEPPLVSRPIYIWTRSLMDIDPSTPGTFYVNYVTHPSTGVYRETLREGTWHFETLDPIDVPKGIRSHKLIPGKIYPHGGVEAVRESLYEMGIVTFGRFASWRPDELAHETYKQARDWKQNYV